MENASKALIMAGAVLISVAIMSIFIYVFTAIGDLNSATQAQHLSNQVIAANRFFVESSYDVDSTIFGIQIYGYDVYNIIRKIKDLNNNETVPVTITINSHLTEQSFVSNPDSKVLTDRDKIYLLKKFTYSYNIDVDGYVCSVTFSEV